MYIINEHGKRKYMLPCLVGETAVEYFFDLADDILLWEEEDFDFIKSNGQILYRLYDTPAEVRAYFNALQETGTDYYSVLNIAQLEKLEEVKVDVLQQVPLEYEEARPGVYLYMFHGRHTADENLDSWGFDGPALGPLDGCHTTYLSHIRIKYAEWPDWEDVGIVEDMIHFDGKYYGDWSVCDEAGLPKGIKVLSTIECMEALVRDENRKKDISPLHKEVAMVATLLTSELWGEVTKEVSVLQAYDLFPKWAFEFVRENSGKVWGEDDVPDWETAVIEFGKLKASKL